MKNDKWGKRAEKIVAMTQAQLRAAVEKADPMPTEENHESAAHSAARDRAMKNRVTAHKAAMTWLRTTAKEGGPKASHARFIMKEMRRSQKECEDFCTFVQLFSHVRKIDVAGMMMLITGC
jgi:hypothetical protein